MRRPIIVVLTVVLLLLLRPAETANAQGLSVQYGPNGLQTVSYGGVVLEDLNAHAEDAFHIWHMKATDLLGNVLSNGQYGWGESNNGRTWDGSRQTWTYSFTWGSIKTQLQQAGDSLNIVVTVVNNPNSGIIFDGATLYPFALHFPQQPKQFTGGNVFADNRSGPSVTVADYAAGQAVAVAPDAAKPLYSGFQSTGSANVYTALVSSTSPDGLPTFAARYDRPVRPGETDTFTVSLRFAPSGASTADLASDAYQSWAATYPPQLHWADRRILGTAYLASSPSGDAHVAGGFPNNPRRYFNDSNGADFDITTAAGLARFQARVLQQARDNVQNLQRLGAQGAITWDIEGEQFPQETSYVCSPDQIALAAPEMESVVTDITSSYAGMKLDDAYFKIMKDAGFRIGVCIRPQQFSIHADGTAYQDFLPAAQVPAQLIRKMQYAHDRWGATLFYVDSTVDENGGTLDAGIFQQVQAALPDSLIIPEETTPRHFAYTAPFASFLFHNDLGTDSNVYNYYPKAFTANLINDVDPVRLAQYQTQLTDAVRRGDILMVHADYWQANNPTVVSMYQAAGITAPVQTTPVISWPAPPPISFGTALSATQLNATANVPGTFTYNPAAGVMLPAGPAVLSTTFTPADTTSYTAAAASVPLTVNPRIPSITFAVSDHRKIDPSFQVAASSNSSGAFSYAVVSGPAVVSDATVTLTGSGTVVLQAAQAASGGFTSGVQTASFHVSSGALWLGHTDGSLDAVELMGSDPSSINHLAGGSGPVSSMAFDHAGNLWNAGPGGVNAFDNNGVPRSSQPYTGGGINNPLALAIDGGGQVWAANQNGTVSLLSNAGSPLSPQTGYSAAGMSGPGGLAVDLSGNVWISNKSDNSVTELIGVAAPAAPPSTALANSITGVRP